jgi:hypothetical protein
MTYVTNGSIVLYVGNTPTSMLPLPYTMVGKTTNGQITGCSIIQTTTVNSFLSLNAAAGNSAAINIAGNASTTNASATAIIIQQIG